MPMRRLFKGPSKQRGFLGALLGGSSIADFITALFSSGAAEAGAGAVAGGMTEAGADAALAAFDTAVPTASLDSAFTAAGSAGAGAAAGAAAEGGAGADASGAGAGAGTDAGAALGGLGAGVPPVVEGSAGLGGLPGLTGAPAAITPVVGSPVGAGSGIGGGVSGGIGGAASPIVGQGANLVLPGSAADTTDAAGNIFNNAINPGSATPYGPPSSSVAGGTVADATVSPSGGSGLSGLLNQIGVNKGMILPAAAMGASLLAKPKTPDLSQLDTIAQQLQGGSAAATNEANALIPTVTTGNLPPGASALISGALNDAKEAIKSKYASMGMSGSTMEQQELSQAESSAAAQSFQMANTLTNTGLTAAGIGASELGSSASIYDAIMQAQLQQDQQLQQSLAAFASASALGGGLSSLAAAKTGG